MAAFYFSEEEPLEWESGVKVEGKPASFSHYTEDGWCKMMT